MGLRAANGETKIALFMDKLSVHRSEKVKATMKELGFRVVFCVAYSPELNPQEFVFSKFKHAFKVLR